MNICNTIVGCPVEMMAVSRSDDHDVDCVSLFVFPTARSPELARTQLWVIKRTDLSSLGTRDPLPISTLVNNQGRIVDRKWWEWVSYATNEWYGTQRTDD
jgi:hypothetical protein